MERLPFLRLSTLFFIFDLFLSNLLWLSLVLSIFLLLFHVLFFLSLYSLSLFTFLSFSCIMFFMFISSVFLLYFFFINILYLFLSKPLSLFIALSLISLFLPLDSSLLSFSMFPYEGTLSLSSHLRVSDYRQLMTSSHINSFNSYAWLTVLHWRICFPKVLWELVFMSAWA